MKTKAILTILLSWMMATGALADDDRGVLCVHLKDGNTVQFVLPEKKPSLGFGQSHGKDWLTVSYLYEDGINYASVDFDRDEVDFLNIVPESKLSVESAKTDEPRIQFDLTRAGVVRVSGLKDADRVQVYRIDGKSVQADVNRHGSEAIVSLDNERRGIYLVSVNNSFTFKMMKP